MPRTAVIALALATLAAAACRKDPAPPPGDIAVRLTLPTLAGDAFDPQTLRGKPTAVVFWRPSCPHCQAELPDVARACREKGANAVAVMVTGNAPTAEKVLKGASWTGPALVDDGTLRKAFDIKAVPYTLILRGDGRATHAYLGRQSYDTIADALGDAR